MINSVFFLFLFELYAIQSEVQPSNFVPYGIDSGDTPMDRRLNALTPPIKIKALFPYFNEKYDEIKLWSHGLILFGNQTYNNLPHAVPGRFPLPSFICVSPYWADTDITTDQNSNIFYREIDTDVNALLIITDMVKRAYPALTSQRMFWAFVATWDRVPGHESSGHGRTKYISGYNNNK
ncbi:unnamed protein product [Didymodactylos carnosus]|uniref:NIDO domain-containing protein n=1 Tax=Didymodactylos carnosus TaxID=1234261 RepID=A0A815UEL6_9BILA|nr:unnamed protein product [Didymodactylos carnosus]CAF4374915.1 unnamed protein product [Didymodactylos carnosus]